MQYQKLNTDFKKAFFYEEVDKDNSNTIQNEAERFKALLNYQWNYVPLQTESSVEKIEENIIRAVPTALSFPKKTASYNIKIQVLRGV